VVLFFDKKWPVVIIEEMNSKRGSESEDKFYKLLTSNLPVWAKDVVRPFDIEDSRWGIDFHVRIDDKKSIPVEIKSSYRGLKNYATKRGPHEVCIIIIQDKLSDSENVKNILTRLEDWKSQHLL
jgi:hypothetical protein